jgi:hypothetical protein
MGFSSSSSTKTSDATVKPVYEGQILGAYNSVNGAFDKNQGNLEGIQGLLSGQLGQAVNNYSNNPTQNAAKGYVTDTLGGSYNQNPFLDQIINQTNADVGNRANAMLGTRGLAGGSVAAKTIGGQLASNEGNLRFSDYNNWQQRRAQAAGMAPGLAAADSSNLSSLLNLGTTAANLTTDNALKRAAAVSGLLGQYTNGKSTETTKSSKSLLDILSQMASNASQAAAGGA